MPGLGLDIGGSIGKIGKLVTGSSAKDTTSDLLGGSDTGVPMSQTTIGSPVLTQPTYAGSVQLPPAGSTFKGDFKPTELLPVEKAIAYAKQAGNTDEAALYIKWANNIRKKWGMPPSTYGVAGLNALIGALAPVVQTRTVAEAKTGAATTSKNKTLSIPGLSPGRTTDKLFGGSSGSSSSSKKKTIPAPGTPIPGDTKPQPYTPPSPYLPPIKPPITISPVKPKMSTTKKVVIGAGVVAGAFLLSRLF